MKAAREMPSQPTWLFDSLLLRQALANVNLPAVPAIVRAACGVSQRDIAAMAGWNQATLSYYERGIRDGMYDIRTALHFADAVGMPRAALLPLLFADADLNVGDLQRMDLIRPDLGGVYAAAGLPAALPAATAPHQANRSHVRYWHVCADTLYAHGQSIGGTVLLPLAIQQWRQARLAARYPGPETADHLLGAAAELALCTGWIALDSEQLPIARPLYEEASKLAAASGDTTLSVHVLTNQSMLYAELAHTGPSREPARQALQLAFQAQEEGRYLTVPRLHALIALRHASSASLLGDKTSFQVAITRARNELDRGPNDDKPPSWLRFVDHAEIAGAEARGWLNLGDPARSALLYQQALASELSPRNRASYGAELADALLRQGARQAAVTAAMDVLPALEGGVKSMRCLNQLRLVRQVAGSTGESKEFRDRFDAIEQTFPAGRTR
jgi:transcriptional regulator with XRE-family HTH domain